jgi:anti-sigma factor RsiW
LNTGVSGALNRYEGALSDHISTQLLEGYSQRRLEAAELLALDDHLSTCPACREMWRKTNPRVAELLALQASLEVADETAPTHLSGEELAIYAAGGLDEIDRELAESHFEVCPQCAAQAQRLRAQTARDFGAVEGSSASPGAQAPPGVLSARMTATSSPPSLQSRFLLAPLSLRVAGAVAMLALLILAFALWLRGQKEGSAIVGRPSAPSPSISHSPTHPAPEAPPVKILLALNDGAGTITLDSQGNFGGLDSLSPPDQHRVKAALETGEVQISKTIKELRDSSAPNMGGSSGGALALIGPAGAVVAGRRPTFRWLPLNGATSYQITITDPAAGYKEVVSSPQLQGRKWTVDRPLERGRVYTWQITARAGDGEVKSPEAKFKVLDPAAAGALARVNKIYAGRRLALGLLYAEAGLLDDAERELKALLIANPQSPIAKSLWLDLRSKQRRP